MQVGWAVAVEAKRRSRDGKADNNGVDAEMDWMKAAEGAVNAMVLFFAVCCLHEYCAQSA